ncbi:NACHT domain-containing protein [Streptomyces sp. NBC_01443]|uniref:NACHT domain-containing protein n=1 Tax=Streptomyces sp. NBC_01443 TaxID=2903868 RepID=UPI00225A5AFA|nr:NACHT domain-containing protein [Streptomyces sp. NBC_01443]MCX4630598.1 NACHT domain-containing protein [Streptomyces sp. NBC_01443]
MTGFETVLLRVAGTAAGALVKSLLSRSPGAGLAVDPAAPVPRWRRPAELGAAEVRRLAETLAARLGEATRGLPEHERLAALDAVGDAFAALGPLNAESLFAADLDPHALAAALPPPSGAGLSRPAEAVYRDLVRLCCVHAVEYLTTLPGFGARADVELVRRTGELARAVDRLGDRSSGAAHAFEEQYARYVAETHSRLQLFGLTLSHARQEWPLDLAYISLAVTGEQLLEEPGRHSAMKTELALSTSERVLLRGPAGSGKSTLVQWLALNAARRSFKLGLRHWNTLVPFVLRLRSFNSPEGLPMPENWLRASGVPLRAPEGWVENLLSEGRALVLVDGVDEVPSKLRSRTEEWLRSLLAAYPRARYVVTTRPSAVPEDWLTGQAFSLLSLLPMERADVSAFITHWHDSARAECGSEEERDSLDRYEKSLIQSVGSRRDLGWLASNPLMCALLCALNRDRHMHLPRARKELYDAALDMLLVRRDTERDISGVEGVYLSRDEQTLLLQRLAYWLIRNGQVEASCTEAEEMVGEWLGAMPQVRAQAGAEQVFRHLLIRSGLLREPVPGSVHFVHRTFQDYLGAKAAVEARDFGVLVGNAHEDAWEDVVRMAVGHARPDERARLLRQLLRRADKVKRDHSRLVLLAAACLEHAPELDPEVWREVEARTAHLLPPHSVGQAEELAKAGELVLELLPGPKGLDEQQAAAVIRTAALVGGERALQVIAGFRRDDRYDVVHELSDSWGRFPTDTYADAVLADAPVRVGHLHVRTPEQLAVLGRMPHIRRVHLTWNGAVPTDISGRRDLEWLVIHRNPSLTDLAPLAGHPTLRHLGVLDCPEVTGIEAVAELSADSLAFGYLREGLSLAPLAAVDGLKSLVIGFEPAQRWIGDVPAAEGLTSLALWQGVRRMTLDGIERWPGVKDLTIAGSLQYRQLIRSLPLPGLGSLQIRHAAPVSVAALLPYQRLTELVLIRCVFEGTLEPLTELAGLRLLVLRECLGTVDLSPFAEVDGLVIEVDRRTSVIGTESIPPERLVYKN